MFLNSSEAKGFNLKHRDTCLLPRNAPQEYKDIAYIIKKMMNRGHDSD